MTKLVKDIFSLVRSLRLLSLEMCFENHLENRKCRDLQKVYGKVHAWTLPHANRGVIGEVSDLGHQDVLFGCSA